MTRTVWKEMKKPLVVAMAPILGQLPTGLPPLSQVRFGQTIRIEPPFGLGGRGEQSGRGGGRGGGSGGSGGSGSNGSSGRGGGGGAGEGSVPESLTPRVGTSSSFTSSSRLDLNAKDGREGDGDKVGPVLLPRVTAPKKRKGVNQTKNTFPAIHGATHDDTMDVSPSKGTSRTGRLLGMPSRFR